MLPFWEGKDKGRNDFKQNVFQFFLRPFSKQNQHANLKDVHAECIERVLSA